MNKKGFTLAEVIGVIVLLSIVALITIPFVESYIKKSKESSYNTTIKEIVKAARDWNSKYGHTVTWTNDKKLYKLSLNDLKKSEFLEDEDIIDPTNNQIMNGCIFIRINDKNAYTYEYVAEGCGYGE